jgi:hypothetical protein
MFKCGFDVGCHLWGLWFGLPLVVQLLIIGGVVLIIGGTILNWGRLVKAIAGWPGVAGFVALLVAVVTFLALTGRKATEPLRAPTPKIPSLPSIPKAPRPKPKRRYNHDKDIWEPVP